MSTISTLELEGGSQAIDLRHYWRIIWRRRVLIAVFFLIVVAGAALFTLRQKKVYSSQVSVIIDVTAPQYLDNQIQDISADSHGNYWANREYYETQLKVMTSRAVAQRVVDKLQLQKNAAFLGVGAMKDAEAQKRVLEKIDAVPILQSRLHVEPIKDSRITLIRVEDSDPQLAAAIANETAEAYAQENLTLKLRTIEKASQWLEERKDNLEGAARQSELAVYDFKKQSDVLTTSLEDRQSIVSARLQATSQAINEVRNKIAALRARVDTIRAVQKNAAKDDLMWAEALPSAQESAAIRDFKTRYVTQKTECAELRKRYEESHPKLTACLEKFAQTEKDFQRELSNLVASAENALHDAVRNEANLLHNFDDTKKEAFEVNKKQIEFDRLKRESENNQRLYDVVLKRLKDIELSGLLRTSNVRVLDAARPSSAPTKPNVLNNMLLALLVGLVGGLALAMVLEFLDSSIKSQTDIEERLKIPFLGVVPSVQSDVGAEELEGSAVDLFVHRNPKSIVAECCRSVRTNLLYMTPDDPIRTMVVTSSGPKEGKSTTVMNMGIAMAQSGNRVLLIDTDMRRPRLHKAFGVPNDVGVSSLIVGEGTLDQAVKSTEVPGLFLLPCGPVPPNPAELLHTRAFHDLLEKLAQKFDKIILDSPPVGAVADAVVLSTQVGGVVLVLQAGQTNRDVASRMIRTLRDVNARVLGAVLNDIDLHRAAYGDYYGYSYQYYRYSESKEGAS